MHTNTSQSSISSSRSVAGLRRHAHHWENTGSTPTKAAYSSNRLLAVERHAVPGQAGHIGQVLLAPCCLFVLKQFHDDTYDLECHQVCVPMGRSLWWRLGVAVALMLVSKSSGMCPCHT